MNKIIDWFIGNSVAANLFMLVLLIGGGFSAFTLHKEIFPELDSEFITISVIYPGAAPSEVEDGVIVRIEEAIESIEGIKRLESRSFENIGVVTAELKRDVSTAKVLDEVKSAVDSIDTFPEDIERPIVEESTNKRQVINVALYGEEDEFFLTKFTDEIREEIIRLPGISQVEVSTSKNFEMSVEVSEDKLNKYGITFDEIVQAIRSYSIDIPGGVIKGKDKDILLRTKGQSYTSEQFGKIVLRSNTLGATPLLIRDVANIRDTLADVDKEISFNGHQAILIQVFRVGEEDALSVAESVKEYIVKRNKTLPSGIHLNFWRDRSEILKSRISLLVRNARLGIILVFLVLALFLKPSLAFWVTLGLPISFAGTFLLMPEMDLTVNMISLFGFILVLGIVVDDAIVVGESIHACHEEGMSYKEAAVVGTRKVAISVIFSVLTTIVAFLALTSIPGNMGKIFGVISWVVILTLMFSLVESLFILPVHLAHDWLDKALFLFRKPLAPWYKLQNKFEKGLKNFINFKYIPFLKLVVKLRYIVAAFAFASLVATFGFVKGGWISFSFFPKVESNHIAVGFTFPEGTSANISEYWVKRIEQSAQKVRQDIIDDTGEDVFRHIMSAFGAQPTSSGGHAGQPASPSSSNGNVGEVTVELTEAESRSLSAKQIEQMWRLDLGEIPGVEDLYFASSIFSLGDDINVQIAGDDFKDLGEVSEWIKSEISKYAGVYEISDNYKSGKEEYKISLSDQGKALGVNLAQLGRQVRQAFYGEEAQRIQRGSEDVRVMVRYPEKERRDFESIRSMKVRLPDGRALPFSSIARIDEGKGFSTITRVDRLRTVSVTANVDESKNNAQKIRNTITKELFPKIQKRYLRVYLSFEGAQREQRDAIGGLIRGLLVALLLIYALIAIPFKSYAQPIIIMIAIPFGLIGAVIGHFCLGLSITIMSIFGLVALTGVVVNDGILIVNFMNDAKLKGESAMEVVLDAGFKRFRPVVLTSITTFAGLAPMMFERSVQAQFLVPVAVSLGVGVLFATMITLLLIPACYMILEDVTQVAGKKIKKLFPADFIE